MKYEKEVFIHLTNAVENKSKREKVMQNAKSTFTNIKSPEDRAENFISENEKLIEDLYHKERREEFKKLIQEVIDFRVPIVQRESPNLFRIKIEIEPVFLFVPKEERK